MFTSLGFEALNIVNQLAEKRARTRCPAISEPLLVVIRKSVGGHKPRQYKAKAHPKAQTTNGDTNGQKSQHVSSP